MVRVAVIGAGVMGADHARILSDDVPGAILQVVCDANGDRAETVANECDARHAATDAMATAVRADVDAVLVASPDDTHAALTIAAIQAGKPVLCEKPLAPTPADCLKIIEAETQVGKKLIQTGFMRRFDPAYVAMKSALDAGTIGPALMMHNFHRNVAAPDWFTASMAISNSAPHEFDIARFVLGREYSAITAFQVLGEAQVPPVMMVLETNAGQIVNVEVNNNAVYGYDVRGEVVGTEGTVDLGVPVHAVVNTGLQAATAYAEDWRPRFAEAYRLQNKAWIESIKLGAAHPHAADAWDGYVATLVAEAGVSALSSGVRTPISMAEQPPLYARDIQAAKEGSAR